MEFLDGEQADGESRADYITRLSRANSLATLGAHVICLRQTKVTVSRYAAPARALANN